MFESIQKAPDENILSNISAKMVRVFKQPACMSQINKQTIDGLNVAQSALDMERGRLQLAAGQGFAVAAPARAIEVM